MAKKTTKKGMTCPPGHGGHCFLQGYNGNTNNRISMGFWINFVKSDHNNSCSIDPYRCRRMRMWNETQEKEIIEIIS